MSFDRNIQIKRIEKAMEANNFEIALQEISLGLFHDPNFEGWYYYQGICHQNTENNSQAILSFTKLLHLNPTSYNAHYHLAALYYKSNEYKKGATHIEFCIEQEPNNGPLLALAALLYMHDRPLKAERLFKKAKKNAPNHELVLHAETTFAYMGLKLGALKKILIKNMEEDPTSASSIAGMGVVALSNKDVDKASELLLNSYKIKPSEDVLDAYIDSRLAHYLPFSWFIPLGWAGYLFPPLLILPIYLIFTFISFAILDKHPTYLSFWLPYVQMVVIGWASLFYVLKFPIQYLYKRIYFPMEPWLSSKDRIKLALMLLTGHFIYSLFNFQFNVLLFGVFLAIYIPLWILVKNRTLISTKLLYSSLYILAWFSLVLNIFPNIISLSWIRWLQLPALLVWLVLMLSESAVEKIETYYKEQPSQKLGSR